MTLIERIQASIRSLITTFWSGLKSIWHFFTGKQPKSETHAKSTEALPIQPQPPQKEVEMPPISTPNTPSATEIEPQAQKEAENIKITKEGAAVEKIDLRKRTEQGLIDAIKSYAKHKNTSVLKTLLTHFEQQHKWNEEPYVVFNRFFNFGDIEGRTFLSYLQETSIREDDPEVDALLKKIELKYQIPFEFRDHNRTPIPASRRRASPETPRSAIPAALMSSRNLSSFFPDDDDDEEEEEQEEEQEEEEDIEIAPLSPPPQTLISAMKKSDLSDPSEQKPPVTFAQEIATSQEPESEEDINIEGGNEEPEGSPKKDL